MSLPSNNAPTAQVTFLAPGNVYFAKCAMLLQVEAGLEQRWRGVPDNRFAAIVERHKNLMSPEVRLPTMEEPPAATLAGTVARLAIAMQRSAGLDVAGWKEVPGQEGLAIFVCADQATGKAAAALALRALAGDRETERDVMMQRLVDAARPWVKPLARAAVTCGIPMAIVLGGDSPFIALGQGQKRRLFWKNFTHSTCHIGTVLTTRKDMASTLMREAGLPAPRNILVRNAAEAFRAADAFGYPVVVKPVSADYGRGVSTDIQDVDQVSRAFLRASEYGPVLVEEQISGDHHRLLVLHGRCIAVSRRLPARVVGDGVSTVSELVETINLTRTDQLSPAGVKIKLDATAIELLQKQNLSISSVPSRGKIVLLRGNANQSAGGTVEMMTEVAHPDVLRLAERAAGLFGIDAAGIDYLTCDVTRSPLETGGAICEVNVTPGFVNQGEPITLIRELLSPFFPAGDDGRIPTICLLAPSGSAHSLADGLPFLFEGQVARADRVKLWSARANRAPAPLHRRVSAALADPLATAALIPCTPEEVVRFGLGLETCAVTIVMPGVAGDALEAMLRVTQVAVVSACVAASMPDVLSAAACRIWIVGEPPTSISDRCTGWIRRAEGGAIEVCTAAGAVRQITDPGRSDENLFLVAAGIAMNLAPSSVVAALHSASSKRPSA